MRIGVLSDTHMPRRVSTLPNQMLQDFRNVDMILHAGDLISLPVLRELEKIAPTFAVHGNVDPPEITEELPWRRIITAGRYKIGLVHGNRGTDRTTPQRALETFEGEGMDCIVFGHSHQPYNEIRDGILLFNPGSATLPRWEPNPSYGILHVDEKGIHGEIILLPKPR